MPFADTEEFANIGIILCVPKQGLMFYKLVKSTDSRVKAFFRDDRIYPFAKEAIVAELKFARDNVGKFGSPDMLSSFFHSFVSKRESIFQFSDSRVIMSEFPAKTLESLYDRYINHTDYTPERREDILAKELHMRFETYNDLKRVFRRETIGGEFAKFTMPLVAMSDGYASCSIKPLAFDQSDSSKMMEHCDKWTARVIRAADEGLLSLPGVLFPIAGLLKATVLAKNALEKIYKTFGSYHIKCVGHDDEQSIIHFDKSTL